MPRPETRSPAAYLGAGAALLALLGANLGMAFLVRGAPWALLPLLAVSLVQAGLVLVFLMNLPRAGTVARIYLGLAVMLLIIATLTLADYLTRTSPLDPS